MTNAIDNHQNHAQAEKTVAMLARMEPKGIEFVDYEMFYELISLPGSTLRDEKKDVCIHDIYLDDRHFLAVDALNTSFIVRMG
ncbi:hypothetical protein [Klebsiella pneumoniae]|uniref:hypothetical protein n=1 Tax=Klebsiella pneumoniae TaxID=573 RepID=UPI0010CE0956|nr:hypothetical protein [Klebsiella pneumoniae]VTN85097.1 Uncharacterised protein [Klebsiella pneumoniae]